MKKSRKRNIIKTYETIGVILLVLGFVIGSVVYAFEVKPFTFGTICCIALSISMFFLGWGMVVDASNYKKRNKR